MIVWDFVICGSQINNNNFSGTLPAGLGELTNVSMLHVANNSFSGKIPTGLGGLKSVISLRLEGNSLEGDIPQDIFEGCTNLVNL